MTGVHYNIFLLSTVTKRIYENMHTAQVFFCVRVLIN